jgi:hypothetical protein
VSTVEGFEVMTFEEGYHPSFTLGSDWVSLDGGKTVQYQGKSRKPKMGKNYGRMLNQVADITEGINPDPLDSIDPVTAASWLGTKWTLERVDVDFGKQVGTHEVELPTAYLGRGTAQAAIPQAPVTAAAPVASAPVTAPVPPIVPGENGLRTTVVGLANTAATFEEFRAAALNIPGVLTDQALIAEIVDQANGIFAKKA